MTLCYVSGLKTARVACAFSMSRNRVSSKSGTPRMHEKSTHLITYGPGSKLTICSINVGFSQTAIPDALNSKLVSIVLIKLVYHHAKGRPIGLQILLCCPLCGGNAFRIGADLCVGHRISMHTHKFTVV